MTSIQEMERDATSGVDVANSLEGLAGIRRPGCAALAWRREPLPRFQTWIDQLDPSALPRARMVLRPAAVRDAVTHVCDVHGTPEGDERRMLIDDIASLSAMFAEIMRTPYLRVRLDVVTSNACRKFHVDAVFARLICTYRGTGTQYGASVNGAQPTNVVTTPTGAPLVLRGTLWPEDPPSGLLHRSPPIEGSGETRLLLVLDPIDDPDDEVD